MAKICHYLALVSLLGAADTVFSEEQKPNGLTFYSYINAVDQQHPELTINDLSLTQAKESSKRSGVLPDPQISFGRDEVPFRGRLQPRPEMAQESKDAAQWKLGLSQGIPWPGTLAAEERISQSQVTNIEIANNIGSLTRRLEAANLFLKIIRTDKLLKLQKENFRVVDGIRELTHEKFRQSIGSHNEFLQAHSESGLLKIAVASLETDLLNLKRHALFFINHPSALNPSAVEFSLEWPESLLKTQATADPKQTDLVKSQIEQQKNASIARQEYDYKRSLPSLMASGELMEEDSGMRMYGAMFGISIPIFSHSQRSSISNENKIIQIEVDQKLAWQDRQKQLVLLQAESRLDQIRSNLKTLESDIIPPVREHIEATTVQFSQGKLDIGSIISARRTLLNLQMSEVGTVEALARAQISIQKINAGLIDDELDQEVPQLIGIGNSMNMPEASKDHMRSKNGKRKSDAMTLPSGPNSIQNQNNSESESDRNTSTPGMGM